jgi:sugar lactone lactonase YvrE
LAQLNPGLDNLTLVGDRLFASNFTGEVTEILRGGETHTVLPGGLNWPLDLAVGDDGKLYVADGTYFYSVGPGGSLQTVGMLFWPGYPGFLRGLAAAGLGEFVVTTSGGQIARYRPAEAETDYLADGFDQLYGIAIGPGDDIVFAELGTGRVHALRSGNVEMLASGLQDPVGVAFDSNGSPLVAESGAGRVVRLGGSRETVVDGLQRPQGILVADGTLYIVDAGAREVIAVDLSSGDRRTIASGLPVGPPPGVEPKPLKGMPPFSGPQGPFAGIAIGPDGTLYVSADGDGSVLTLRRA